MKRRNLAIEPNEDRNLEKIRISSRNKLDILRRLTVSLWFEQIKYFACCQMEKLYSHVLAYVSITVYI